ncbi:MAG: 23S rRNA (adenine(2503)-C(2))-methyltransferase RlmN [Coriobacteriia bacterium]|nr:23S rRNA (adenine(2503)-C(2))-methyltransferase RlmN [Coriobacteriia bacterium]
MQHQPNSNFYSRWPDIFAYGLTEAEAVPSYSELMKSLGQPSFRAKQLAQWLWVRGANSYADMTNLPATLRTQLEEVAPLQRAEVECVQHSKDGTRKYLLRFADGTCVEAVGLPSTDTESQRLSVCLSSQAGCALACTFCATGRGGLSRSLLPGEIAEQLRVISADFGRRVSNVVVMGQGEPFQNYGAVLAGLRLLNADTDNGGFGIGARHITISTAGIIKGIDRLTAEPEQFTLAVSLHSAVQETRDKIMPGLKGQSLEKLGDSLVRYYKKTKRRPSLEYALIDKTNTSPSEVAALTNFAQKTKAHVNLIPLNEIEVAGGACGDSSQAQSRAAASDRKAHLDSSTKLKSANQEETQSLARKLSAAGIQVTVRQKRGADIDAACGQLAQTR